MNLAHIVRDAVPIEEVIGTRVVLQRSGNSWKGKCPFHGDQNPSFYVSPSKKIYRCFSCGKGGDVIRFVSEYENISFLQAITHLSKQYSITLPKNYLGSTSSQDKQSEIIKKLHNIAKMEYQKCLSSSMGVHARKYLESRGFSSQSCEKFGIGYSPNAYGFLWNILQRMGITQKVNKNLLLQSGLFVLGKNGDTQDFFRDRIMFPIEDTLGESTLGFGARIFQEQMKSPKYLNSPETVIFQKRGILYGLSHARDISRLQKKIFLVEGYTDVIACIEKNIPAIAPLGTAVTEYQIKQASKYAEILYLIFDGDEAGKNAGNRAAIMSVESGISCTLVLLPTGEDPQSFLQKYTLDEFDAYITENGQDVYKFVIQQALQSQSENIPRAVRIEKSIKHLRLIASKISNLDLKKIFWRQVCSVYGSFSLQDFNKPQIIAEKSREKKEFFLNNGCEEKLFFFLCVYPKYVRESFSLIQFKYLDYLPSQIQKLFKMLFSLSEKSGFDFCEVVTFFKEVHPEIEKKILEETLQREQDSPEQIEQEFWDLTCSFLKNHVSHQIQSAMEKLKERGSFNKELLESILTLTKERENLHSYLSGEMNNKVDTINT